MTSYNFVTRGALDGSLAQLKMHSKMALCSASMLSYCKTQKTCFARALKSQLNDLHVSHKYNITRSDLQRGPSMDAETIATPISFVDSASNGIRSPLLPLNGGFVSRWFFPNLRTSSRLSSAIDTEHSRCSRQKPNVTEVAWDYDYDKHASINTYVVYSHYIHTQIKYLNIR